jgi:hypothetical protein
VIIHQKVDLFVPHGATLFDR